jgi:hypothetical protein
MDQLEQLELLVTQERLAQLEVAQLALMDLQELLV